MELEDLTSKPNIVGEVKQIRRLWLGYVERTGECRAAIRSRQKIWCLPNCYWMITIERFDVLSNTGAMKSRKTGTPVLLTGRDRFKTGGAWQNLMSEVSTYFWVTGLVAQRKEKQKNNSVFNQLQKRRRITIQLVFLFHFFSFN